MSGAPGTPDAGGIRIAEYVRLDQPRLLRWLRQCGVTDAVLRLPEVPAMDEGGPRGGAAGSGAVSSGAGGPLRMPDDPTSVEAAVREVEEAGFRVRILEPLPPFDTVKLGLPGRDAQIERIHQLLHTMDRLDIRILCHNWMGGYGWGRTRTQVPGRGGAWLTGFDVDDLADLPARSPAITEEQMWDNYAYFLDAVLPVAEECGVQLALHPDDPPVSPFRGVARVMRSVDALERAMRMGHGSPAQGLTFCQGTIAEMGEDLPTAVERLAPWIRFVHFRDVIGTAERFTETFLDEGPTDMAAMIRVYRDAGFSGFMRSDHVPTLAGESDDHPGYGELGRLFSVGYMRGLLDAASSSPEA